MLICLDPHQWINQQEPEEVRRMSIESDDVIIFTAQLLYKYGMSGFTSFSCFRLDLIENDCFNSNLIYMPA